MCCNFCDEKNCEWRCKDNHLHCTYLVSENYHKADDTAKIKYEQEQERIAKERALRKEQREKNKLEREKLLKERAARAIEREARRIEREKLLKERAERKKLREERKKQKEKELKLKERKKKNKLKSDGGKNVNSKQNSSTGSKKAPTRSKRNAKLQDCKQINSKNKKSSKTTLIEDKINLFE